MEATYRLEFNVKQQCFNLSNHNKDENTFGWFTITENCTEKEFIIFKCFLKREIKGEHTAEYILKSFTQLNRFWNQLLENRLVIN